MKKKNRVWIIMTISLSFLIGCVGRSPQTNIMTETEESQHEKEVKIIKNVEGADTENVTLRVSLWDYSSSEYYKKQFEAFSQKYPNINIEVVESSAADYEDMIITKMAGKENFDVVFTKGLPSLSGLIEMDYLYPLDELIKTDNTFDLNVYNGVIDQMKLKGHIYGVPYRKDNILLFYNKELFDKAGVEYPHDGMTMEEYYDLAKRMTSGYGNSKIYGAHLHTWASNVFLFPRRVGKFDPWGDNKSALKPYYETFLKMQEEGIVQDYVTLKTSNIHYSDVFYNQQAAMMEMGTWFINNLLENVDFRWGVCSVPNVEGIGNTCATGGITPVAIGAYSEHPKEAWEFIKFVTGEEGAALLAECGIVPAYSSDRIKEIFEHLDGAPEGISDYLPTDIFYVDTPLNPNGKEADAIIQEEHEQIMMKSVSVDEGLQRMETRVNKVIGN